MCKLIIIDFIIIYLSGNYYDNSGKKLPLKRVKLDFNIIIF